MEELKEIFTPVVYRMIKEKCTVRHFDDIDNISEINKEYINLNDELDKYIDKNMDPIILRSLHKIIETYCFCKPCNRRAVFNVHFTECKYCCLEYCKYHKCKCCKQFIYTQCHICKKIDFMKIRGCIQNNVCIACQFICCDKCNVRLNHNPPDPMIYCNDCAN